MAEPKAAAARKAGMNVDTKLVRELAELLAETGLTEIEVEDGDRKVRVARGTTTHSVPVAAHAPAATAPAAAPTSATPSAEATDDAAGAL